MSNPMGNDSSNNSPNDSLAAGDLWPAIAAWARGRSPTHRQRQLLADWELSQPRRATAWGISKNNVEAAIERRAMLLQSLAASLDAGTLSLPLPGTWTNWIEPLWQLWLPLAQQMDAQQKELDAPFIQGILGGQGTGKTTLTAILRMVLEHLGHQTIGLSIDDLYLTYTERCELQRQSPQLIWRGPPGTHDLALGLRTLSEIKQPPPHGQIALPQFDKSLHQGQGDRTGSIVCQAPTIAIFEGWFTGARPLSDEAFLDEAALPEPIVTSADCQFARDCNRRLHDYLPLWDFLDSSIVLNPEDYRLSQRWRQQAEQQMKAGGKSGLSDAEILEFVTYFWRSLHPELFIAPLVEHPATRLVVSIRGNRSLGEIYSPAGRYFYSAPASQP